MKFIPNKLQRDLLRRHIGPFVFSFFTVMFLLLMQFLILHIDKLVGKGIPFLVILELIVTNLAYMVVLAAPMAVLVASVVAYGRFAEYRELTALEAAGVNPIKLMTPTLVTAGLMAVFLVWFSNDVLPDANQKARSLFIDIRTKKPGFDLEPHTFYNGIEGYTFLVKRMPADTDSLYDITLFQEPGQHRNKAIIKADRGYLEMKRESRMLTLYLFDGSMLNYLPDSKDRKNTWEKTSFDKHRLSFDISSFAFSRSEKDKEHRSDRTMSSQAMLAVVDTLKSELRGQHKRYTRYLHRQLPSAVRDELSKDTVVETLTDSSPASAGMDTLDKSYPVAVQYMKDHREKILLLDKGKSSLQDLKSSHKNIMVSYQWRKQRISKFMVEVHKKFSIPFACLAFLLIGAPIGMLSRKGNLGFAALVSAGLLTFYWLSIIQGEKLADRLFISPFWGMWTSDIVLTVIGVYLLIRIATPFQISSIWK